MSTQTTEARPSATVVGDERRSVEMKILNAIARGIEVQAPYVYIVGMAEAYAWIASPAQSHGANVKVTTK